MRLAGNLERNIRMLRERLAPRMKRGLSATGVALLEYAKEKVPKDTKALSDSGQSRTVGNGLKIETIVGFGRRDFDASPYGYDRTRRPPYLYAWHVHQMQIEFLKIPAMAKRPQLRQILRENIK